MVPTTYLDAASPDYGHEKAQLLDFAERLLAEGQKYQEELHISARMRNATTFLGGNQYPQDLYEKKKHRAKITFNLVRSIVERKAGMLTDARPQLEIISRTGNTAAAALLQKTIQGIWTEIGLQQALMDGIIIAQKAGHVPAYVSYDPLADFGSGDVAVDFLSPGQVIVDKAVRRASEIQRGEYVIIRNARPLSHFISLYANGDQVKPDRTLSTYSTKETSPSGMGSRIKSALQQQMGSYRKPSRAEEEGEDSAIPRAYEYLLYLNDPTPRRANDPASRLFPRKRLIIWNKDIVLYDGPSRYWDGLYPVELLDWGIETDHPYGESEIEQLKSMQEGINVLLSGVVDNSRLQNDPPRKVTQNVAASVRSELELYGDRPGKVWQLDSLLDMERDPPPALQGIVLSVVNVLVQGIEQSSGLNEASQGRKPADVTSGVAIEALQAAAQVVIRHQARAVEDFLGRIGQLMISRVIQYYTDDRILYLYGNDGEAQKVLWERKRFVETLKQAREKEGEERFEDVLRHAFRDFRMSTSPMSSLRASKLQRYAEAERLVSVGAAPKLDLLKAAEVANPEEKRQEAWQEKLEEAQFIQQAQQLLQGQDVQPNGEAKSRAVGQKEQRVPVARQSAPGVQ